MVDVLSREQRSHCMASIKRRNTTPEIQLRKALWSMGLRYFVRTSLPGRPDIVFSRKKVAIFVDGCFWHKCPIHYQAPTTNADFWERKIEKNVERDQLTNIKLADTGWTVIRIWEHEIRQDLDATVGRILSSLTKS